MTKALELAKKLCLCAELNGILVRPSQTTISLYERQLETFYRHAQAQALRDAAGNAGLTYNSIKWVSETTLYRKADDLEKQP